MAEHEDLSVLGRGIHPMDMNDLNDAPDETVEEGQGHDRQASPSVLWLVKLGYGVFGPFRSWSECRLSFRHPQGPPGRSPADRVDLLAACCANSRDPLGKRKSSKHRLARTGRNERLTCQSPPGSKPGFRSGQKPPKRSHSGEACEGRFVATAPTRHHEAIAWSAKVAPMPTSPKT